MKIPYKIPMGYIAMVLGLMVLLVLTTAGERPNASVLIAYFPEIMLAVSASYFFVTPRDRTLVVTEEGVSVPSILFPPYIDKSCRWEDIISYRLRFNHKMGETLILKTRRGTIKIHSMLCSDGRNLDLWSDSFFEVRIFIEDRVTEARAKPGSENKYR